LRPVAHVVGTPHSAAAPLVDANKPLALPAAVLVSRVPASDAEFIGTWLCHQSNSYFGLAVELDEEELEVVEVVETLEPPLGTAGLGVPVFVG
jgi:hypothetical protein